MKIHYERSRYIYDMYYKKREISKKLYEYCVKQRIVDRFIIAKWKRKGYEKLCCLKCIQTSDTNFKTTCICRVPKSELSHNQIRRCVTCGCEGCASQDGNKDSTPPTDRVHTRPSTLEATTTKVIKSRIQNIKKPVQKIDSNIANKNETTNIRDIH